MSTGVLAGAGPAIGDQTTATTLAYTCAFPSGAQQVKLQINATFPETAATSIAPTNVTAKLDLSQTALGDLIRINAASVTASADLSLVVKHNGESTTATWPNLTAPSAPLPSTGDLTVTMTGPVPPVSETGAGDVTFAADAFGLILTPLTSADAATNPATVKVACTLNPGQTATLAAVAMSTTPGTSLTNQQANPPRKHIATPMDGAFPKNPACNQPDGSESAGDGTLLNAVLLSRTNLNKLNESTPVDGTVYLTNTEVWLSNDFSTFVFCYTGRLDLKPVTTTMMAFGFVPITTTLSYVQVNDTGDYPPMLVDASTDSNSPDGRPSGASSALVEIYISSASINGTPLNVGPNCRTTTPIALDVSNIADVDTNGNEIYPYNGVNGGYLQGNVTIPPFVDCGVDENLDTMLSAPITGPNNLVRVCQGTATPAADGPPAPPVEAVNNCKAP